MYQMISNGCPSGYAFVRDWLGNKCYYGPVKECRAYIRFMEKELKRYLKCNQAAIYGEGCK